MGELNRGEVLIDPFVDLGSPEPIGFRHSIRGDGEVFVAAFGIELPGVAGLPSIRVRFFSRENYSPEVDFSLGEEDDPAEVLLDVDKVESYVHRAMDELHKADADAQAKMDFAKIVANFSGEFGPLDALLSLQEEVGLRRITSPVYVEPLNTNSVWNGQRNGSGRPLSF